MNAKKQQLVQTAETLFSRHGARRITVEEICKTANVSKMTFYKYFKNKTDLIVTIRDKWIQETFDAFDEINRKNIPFPDKIDLMTRWKIEFAKRTHQEFIRELSDHAEGLQEIKTRYLENIKNAQNSGELRSDIDPEFYWMVVSKINEMYQDGSWKAVFSSITDFQKQVRTLLFYGMLKRRDKGDTS